MLPIFFYCLSTFFLILANCILKGEKREKKARVIFENFHFVSMAFFSFDLLFYGQLQIFNQKFKGGSNHAVRIFSYILIILIHFQLIYDFSNFLKISFEKKIVRFPTLDLDNETLRRRARTSIERRLYFWQSNFRNFALLNSKERKKTKSTMMNIVKLFLILAFLVMIVHMRKLPNLVVGIMTGVQLLFCIGYTIVPLRKNPFKSQCVIWLDRIIQVLLLFYFCLMLFFTTNPDNNKYSSSFMGRMQITQMFIFSLIIFLETFSCIFTWILNWDGVEGSKELDELNRKDFEDRTGTSSSFFSSIMKSDDDLDLNREEKELPQIRENGEEHRIEHELTKENVREFLKIFFRIRIGVG